MGDENRERLMECGVDYDGAMERFMGRSDLYLNFVKKFLDDSSYQCMLDAIENMDAETAFRHAHTLKGLCANLSLAKLRQECDELVECLRNGNLNEISEPLEHVEKSYQELITVLKQL